MPCDLAVGQIRRLAAFVGVLYRAAKFSPPFGAQAPTEPKR
jgi:hypothetical protein